MSAPEDLLPEYLLDTLAPEERRRVGEAVAAFPALAREVAEGHEAIAAWVGRQVKPEISPPGVRRRLLDTIAGVERFRPFLGAAGRIFDLTESAVRDILGRVDDAFGWSSFPGGARYFHFQPGPALMGQEAGVVRMAAGTTFPRHQHRAGETTLVLDGLLYDRGAVHGPGSVVEAEAGSTHDYRAGAGRDLVLLSRHGGIVFVD
jgi:ChrR Cupin-like domain